MNPMHPALFSKQGLVVTQLAWDFLKYRPGEQIERAQDYAQKYGAGAGTVQAALQQLLAADTIKVSTKGRWGTYVDEIDYAKLWQYTTRGPVVVSMPLPYSPLYEGLATGLHETFQEGGVPLNLTFIRGSLNRLDSLAHGRCDLAIISQLAFEEIEADKEKFVLARRLGAGTWIENHVLVFRDASFSEIQPGMRIGIDRQSIDHMALIHKACAGHNVEFVDIGYMQVRSALATGEIDATVWNSDDFAVIPAPDFNIIPADQAGFGDLYDTYSDAAIVAAADQRGMRNLLEAVLNIETCLAVQADVVARKRLPSY